MFNEVSYNDSWSYCVSTASSYMSMNWKEHFFLNEEDANTYYKTAKQKGYAVLIVDREGY